MTPAPESHDPDTLAGRMLQRWQRIGLGVRLAYNPGCTCVINCYIGVGRQIAQRGYATEVDVHQRMFRLLLQTASDLALPAAWRHHCASYALHPLTRLSELLAGDAFAVTALHARWQLAHRQLPAAPQQVAKDEGC